MGKIGCGLAKHFILGKHGFGLTTYLILGKLCVGLAKYFIRGRIGFGLVNYFILGKPRVGLAKYFILGKIDFGGQRREHQARNCAGNTRLAWI